MIGDDKLTPAIARTLRDLDAYREAEAYGQRIKERMAQLLEGKPITRATLIEAAIDATAPRVIRIERGEGNRLDVLVEFPQREGAPFMGEAPKIGPLDLP